MQHLLYFFPLPQGHRSFLPIFRRLLSLRAAGWICWLRIVAPFRPWRSFSAMARRRGNSPFGMSSGLTHFQST